MLKKIKSEIAFYAALFFGMFFMTTPVMAQERQSTEQIKRGIEIYFDLDNDATSDYVDETTADKLLENKSWLENALRDLGTKGFDVSLFQVYNDTASQDLIKYQYSQSIINLENKGLNEQYILQMPEVNNFATNAKDKFDKLYGDIIADKKDTSKSPDILNVKQSMEEILTNRTHTYGQLMKSSNSIFSDVANNISLGTANYTAASATKIGGLASIESMIANVQAIANKNNSATLDEKTISNLASSTKDLFKDVTASNSSSSLADAKKQFSEQSDSLFVAFNDIANSMAQKANSSSKISYTLEDIEKVRSEYEKKGITLTDEEILEILNSTTNASAYLRAEDIKNSVLVDSTTKRPISEEKKAEIIASIKNYANAKPNPVMKSEVGFNSTITIHADTIAKGLSSGPFEYKSTEPDNFIIPSDQEVDTYITELLKSNNVEIDNTKTFINLKNKSQNVATTPVGNTTVLNVDYQTFVYNTVGKIFCNEITSNSTAIGYKGYDYSIQIGAKGQNTDDISSLASNDDTVWYYFLIGSCPSKENIIGYGSKNSGINILTDSPAERVTLAVRIMDDTWPYNFSRISEDGYSEIEELFADSKTSKIVWYAGK